MELRITGYTRAGLMPVYDTDERDNINVLQLPNNRRPNRGICTGYFRPPPVIHFSGAAIGSDRNMDDGRKVRGSVHLIGGGEVRWQMVSCDLVSSPFHRRCIPCVHIAPFTMFSRPCHERDLFNI